MNASTIRKSSAPDPWREAELQAEVDRWLAAAEAADAEEDKAFGKDRRGDEMPAWIMDKEQRLAKIREAKAVLEAEAKAAAEAKVKAEQEAEEKRQTQCRKKGGKQAKTPSGEPEAKTQRNFTDPDSRIVLTKDGYIQGYNAQAAVDGAAQVIVAHTLTRA